MKTILSVLVFAMLFVLAPSRCFAMRSIEVLTPQRAKELGIELRAQAAGPNTVWIELEVRTDGKLKNFNDVELQIMEGDKAMISYAPLRQTQPAPGRVMVRFAADRTYLDKITLCVVAGVPMDMVGHELRVKDFVDPAKLR